MNATLSNPEEDDDLSNGMVAPIIHPAPCRVLINDEDIPYMLAASPWPLDSATHSIRLSQLGTTHFCKCLWQYIAPAPFIVDPYTSEFSTVWTPRADHCLSILWFWSHLHDGKTGAWTDCHYHEVLSILLGYRVMQHDFYARVRYMRNRLPKCWVEASMSAPDSMMVVEVFREACTKWLAFVGRFDVWEGMVKGICAVPKTKEEMKKFLQPDWQPQKYRLEMLGDVQRLIAASPKAEELPAHIVQWTNWWKNYESNEATV